MRGYVCRYDIGLKRLSVSEQVYKQALVRKGWMTCLWKHYFEIDRVKCEIDMGVFLDGYIFTIFLQNSNRGREITGFKICYISFLNCRLFTCKVKVITFTLSYVGRNVISSRVSVCQIPVQRKRGNSDWDPDWFGK